MPEDFMDQLAKEKLDNYSADFNPADWDSMATMLDSGKPYPFLVKYLSGLSIFLVLAIAGAGLMSQQSQTDETFSAGLQNTLQHSWASAIITSSAASEKAKEATATADQPSTKIITRDEFQSLTESVSLSNTIQQSKIPLPEQLNTNAKQPDDQETTMEISDNLNRIRYEMSLSILPAILPPHLLKEANYPSEFSPLPIESTTAKGSKRLHPEIGLVLSPDVNITRGLFPGISGGVAIDLPIKNRIALQLVANYSLKHYIHHYHIDLPTYTNTFVLEKSEARIEMLVISLNAKYKFGFHNLIRPFAKVGLGAYFPIREKYIFSYLEGPLIPPVSSLGASNQVTEEYLIKGFAESFYTALDASGNFTPEVYNLKPTIGVVKAGGGMDYFLSHNLVFSAESIMSYPLQKIGVEEKSIQTISFQFGLRYLFR